MQVCMAGTYKPAAEEWGASREEDHPFTPRMREPMSERKNTDKRLQAAGTDTVDVVASNAGVGTVEALV